MMKFTAKNFAPKTLSMAILSVLLTACGGGSDSGGSNTNTGGNNNTSGFNTTGDATVVEVIEEPTDIKLNEELLIDPNANNDDQVSTTPSEEISRAVLTRLNSRRITCGFEALSISKKLTEAADNHANYLMYMSKLSDEQFQGHFEVYKDIYSGNKNPYYTGKYIQDRVSTDAQKGASATAVDYQFKALGENLSFLSYNEAYANNTSHTDIALNSVNGLLAAPYHLASLVSPNFSQVGISYVTGPMKKPIRLSDGSTDPAMGSVLELVSGRPLSETLPKLDEVISYPCNRIVGTAYELTNESPNPFKGTSRDLRQEPIGQPIYILGPKDIQVSQYKMTNAAGEMIPLKQLNSSNDPNNKLKANEVILMPLNPLKPSNMYTVSYQVKVDGGVAQNKSFWFKTKSK